MLWPQQQRTTKIALPIVLFRGHRTRRPSNLMWPISDLMALRALEQFRRHGGEAPARAGDQHPGVISKITPLRRTKKPSTMQWRAARRTNGAIVRCESSRPRGHHRHDMMGSREAPYALPCRAAQCAEALHWTTNKSPGRCLPECPRKTSTNCLTKLNLLAESIDTENDNRRNSVTSSRACPESFPIAHLSSYAEARQDHAQLRQKSHRVWHLPPFRLQCSQWETASC